VFDEALVGEEANLAASTSERVKDVLVGELENPFDNVGEARVVDGGHGEDGRRMKRGRRDKGAKSQRNYEDDEEKGIWDRQGESRVEGDDAARCKVERSKEGEWRMEG